MWSWLTKQKECCHLSEHEQLDFAQLKKFFNPPPPHAIILYFKTYDGLNFPRNIQLILKRINFVSFTIAFIEWDHSAHFRTVFVFEQALLKGEF